MSSEGRKRRAAKRSECITAAVQLQLWKIPLNQHACHSLSQSRHVPLCHTCPLPPDWLTCSSPPAVNPPLLSMAPVFSQLFVHRFFTLRHRGELTAVLRAASPWIRLHRPSEGDANAAPLPQSSAELLACESRRGKMKRARKAAARVTRSEREGSKSKLSRPPLYGGQE